MCGITLGVCWSTPKIMLSQQAAHISPERQRLVRETRDKLSYTVYKYVPEQYSL